ncbi:FecR family protein [Pedobacter sp. PAMC26386]|nr:FecR family protein [Pedobacter sp. PAMC26386]
MKEKVENKNIENIEFEKLWDELPVNGELEPLQKKRLWQNIEAKTNRSPKQEYKRIVYAAAALIIAGFWIVYWNTNQLVYQEVTSQETSKTILLNDSTEIILGQYSKLKYPSEFGWFNRDVFLDGNAIFKVKHNGKSFTVNSGGFKTKVLGTFFKVSMSADHLASKVSLFEGKIEVSYHDLNKKILKPGDQWSYVVKDGHPKLEHDNELQRKNLKLDYKNTALTEVLKQISMIYGVKVKVDGKVTQDMKITGTFYYSSPEQSLAEMGFPFGLKVEKINESTYEIK